MRVLAPQTWAELLECLFDRSWRPDLGRHRLTAAFRGAPASEPLLPALVRGGGEFWRVETPMLRAFRKYARHEAGVRCESVWEWLALAQHHGLPTRLLDWTWSPLVALHFATATLEAPAVVWRVPLAAVRPRLPRALQRVLDREGADVFTSEMLAEAVPSLEHLAKLARRPFPVFFEPPSLDQRIVSQFALFSLMSDPRARLEDWLERERVEDAVVVLLDEALVREARDLLDQANVNERVLLPGLDGLTRWLARYYLPESGNEGGARETAAPSRSPWMIPSRSRTLFPARLARSRRQGRVRRVRGPSAPTSRPSRPTGRSRRPPRRRG